METGAQTDAVSTVLSGRYIVVKAMEDGVVIMGLTRGRDTRSHHSERLDAGEVLVAQFTEVTAAIKVRGRAEILTDVGRLLSGTSDLPAGR
jgi:transcription attenuation protein (tryptophan RNA-binding attenuator protein)